MRIDCQSAIEAIRRYLQNKSNYPFFVVANASSDLRAISASLPDKIRCVCASNFCSDDGLPDEDAIYDVMVHTSSPLLIKGIGDFIMLSGNTGFLWRVAEQTFPQKIIIFCRNQGATLNQIQQQNSKFGANRWCELFSPSDITVIKVKSYIPIQKIKGFKALLQKMEECMSGTFFVDTDVTIDKAKIIETAYDAIRENDPTFLIPGTALDDEQWMEYLTNKDLNIEDPFHWRSFLRFLLQGTDSAYFNFVLQHSPDYKSYRKEIVNALIRLPYSSELFRQLYLERKMFLRQYPNFDISEYVRDTLVKDKERIHYLTDNTLVEKHAILEEITKQELNLKYVDEVYPDLASYFSEYKFSRTEQNLFTDYFKQYKYQKGTNILQSDFLNQVSEISKPENRKYNSFPSRNQLIMQLKGNNCGLFWIDALGVEYLGYIKELAQEMNLWIEIFVGRASLPTLTEFNNSFYDEWIGYKYPKETRLDKIKHEGVGAMSSSGPAIHLVEELEIIRNSFAKIKDCLIHHVSGIESFLLVSDHGASRLCVLNQHENRWKISHWNMEESGKHSGRCCLVSDTDECPESATQDNGYWVLANYDRFRGGRLSENTVEVHGGASLEEVLVPVIRIALSNERIMCWIIDYQDEVATIIKPLDGDMLMRLYCSKTSAHISIDIKGKIYIGEQSETNPSFFSVNLSKHNEIWRSSIIYEGNVYDGDNIITTVKFRIQRTQRATRNDRDGTDFFNS